VQGTANVIAGKWKVLIVWRLSFGSHRFAQLRDTLPAVSEKVLTAQLKELEHDGVICRLASNTVPPQVNYILSDAGNELVTVMEAVCAWGIKHLEYRHDGLVRLSIEASVPPTCWPLRRLFLGDAGEHDGVVIGKLCDKR
jgi:DNA-binding HxlR family transcriptional regulator